MITPRLPQIFSSETASLIPSKTFCWSASASRVSPWIPRAPPSPRGITCRNWWWTYWIRSYDALLQSSSNKLNLLLPKHPPLYTRDRRVPEAQRNSTSSTWLNHSTKEIWTVCRTINERCIREVNENNHSCHNITNQPRAGGIYAQWLQEENQAISGQLPTLEGKKDYLPLPEKLV